MDRILRLPEIKKHFVSVSTSTIYEWMASGNFPKPVQLGARAVGWRQSDINAWLASRAPTKNSA